MNGSKSLPGPHGLEKKKINQKISLRPGSRGGRKKGKGGYFISKAGGKKKKREGFPNWRWGGRKRKNRGKGGQRKGGSKDAGQTSRNQHGKRKEGVRGKSVLRFSFCKGGLERAKRKGRGGAIKAKGWLKGGTKRWEKREHSGPRGIQVFFGFAKLGRRGGKKVNTSTESEIEEAEKVGDQRQKPPAIADLVRKKRR